MTNNCCINIGSDFRTIIFGDVLFWIAAGIMAWLLFQWAPIGWIVSLVINSRVKQLLSLYSPWNIFKGLFPAGFPVSVIIQLAAYGGLTILAFLVPILGGLAWIDFIEHSLAKEILEKTKEILEKIIPQASTLLIICLGVALVLNAPKNVGRFASSLIAASVVIIACSSVLRTFIGAEKDAWERIVHCLSSKLDLLFNIH